MSIINEALKRAKEGGAPEPPPPATAPRPASAGPSKAWIAAGVAVFIAASALYWREFQSRQGAQAKLQAALLQLNDARTQAAQADEEKVRALREMEAVAAKQREVEYDNFEKEKKISDLSKEVHELHMSRETAAPSQA